MAAPVGAGRAVPELVEPVLALGEHLLHVERRRRPEDLERVLGLLLHERAPELGGVRPRRHYVLAAACPAATAIVVVV